MEEQPTSVVAPREAGVLVVMGVSGSGKTTVARLLAKRLEWEFAEGDDLHPAANRAKMAGGVPLDDDDRLPWLERVAAWILAHTASGQPGVITCSALKRSYRDVLRGDQVVFVYLEAGLEVLESRLAGRQGHFMPASLLASQLATLEPPQPVEQAVTVGSTGSAHAVADRVIARLGWNRPSPTR